MHKIKTSMILLWTIFLSSCVRQAIICNQIKTSEVKPLMMYDVSFKYSRCRGRCFDANKWETLKMGACVPMITEPVDTARVLFNGKEETIEVINYPLEHCEDLTGFNYKDMAYEIRPKVKKLHNIKIDNCGE